MRPLHGNDVQYVDDTVLICMYESLYQYGQHRLLLKISLQQACLCASRTDLYGYH